MTSKKVVKKKRILEEKRETHLGKVDQDGFDKDGQYAQVDKEIVKEAIGTKNIRAEHG